MNKALLLIDDKEDFKESFQTLAQRKGYRLAWGKSFEEMEAKLPELYKKITAIVLDIKCLITNDQEIENENFILKALLFLQAEYNDLPRVILTGDEMAFDFSRFSKDELVFRKDPEDIEKMFDKIEEYAINHENRIKTIDEKEFLNIIKANEGRNLEFKSSLQYCTQRNCERKELRFEVLKSIAAFSNSEGGTLFIGLADDKNVYGLEDGDFLTIEGKNKHDSYKLLLDNLIENTFGNGFHSNLEEVKFYIIGDKTVCKLVVKGKYTTPTYVQKKVPNKAAYKAFFIRGQASTRELPGEEMEAYIKANWD